MMEDEVVRRRGWMTRDRLLDLIGAANVIPGPTSTELAIHIGHERGRWPGLVVAGACFILPTVAIVLAIAWAYVRFGTLPAVGGVWGWGGRRSSRSGWEQSGWLRWPPAWWAPTS